VFTYLAAKMFDELAINLGANISTANFMAALIACASSQPGRMWHAHKLLPCETLPAHCRFAAQHAAALCHTYELTSSAAELLVALAVVSMPVVYQTTSHVFRSEML
jgi:hypothetical protein